VGWIADDGTRVKAGEPLVRFDPSEIEKELEDAADELARAHLKAEKERAHGSAEVRKLERDLALAREELAAARNFQKKDETVFSRVEITESEIDEELARNREDHAREARRGQETLSGTELDLLGIDMRQAEAKIRRARGALAALTVTAPHDGVLVLKRNWRGEATRVGDTVWNSQPLAEIPDLAQMQAEVYVLEADAGGLAPGKPATVTLESRPGVEHAARIGRVDALAKPRFRGSPVQYFGITLTLDRTDPGVMKPGQRVRALLRLDERPRALTVPRQAVFERDGKTVVYRWRGGGFEPRFEPIQVELGPSGAGRVVVESGLRPGDAVALADPTKPVEPAGTETPEPAGAPAP
jgi:RND family efflux transporter MFP subunit